MNINQKYLSQLKEIVDNTYLISLATVDESGPWVFDVVFVHDENFNIYWLSQPTYRHSQAILKDSRAAASITLSTKQGEDNKGLQMSGKIEKVEGDLLEISKLHAFKRKKPGPQPGEAISHGQSWYKFTPDKIELIYEPLLGYEKVSLLDEEVR